MAGRQLNIRLDPADGDKPEALAYLRRESESVLVREIVREYLAAHQDEPGMQGALASRVEHDQASQARTVAKVTTLRRPK